jgi:phosphoadenosine phosphosulfate reductase
MFGELKAGDFDAPVTTIKERISSYVKQGLSVFSTSSFQSQSLPLLHIISQLDFTVPIYLTNTGFLHPETLRFADQIAERLNLNVIALRPDTPKISQVDAAGQFFYASDPDYCCFLNKVKPLEPVLAEHDVWINGVRSDQTALRAAMTEEEPAKFGCMRYHPMLAWDNRMVHYYIKAHQLPHHPLEAEGYSSIGCEPCTSKALAEGNARNARWFGMNKTECGLNTTLVKSSDAGLI